MGTQEAEELAAHLNEDAQLDGVYAWSYQAGESVTGPCVEVYDEENYFIGVL